MDETEETENTQCDQNPVAPPPPGSINRLNFLGSHLAGAASAKQIFISYSPTISFAGIHPTKIERPPKDKERVIQRYS